MASRELSPADLRPIMQQRKGRYSEGDMVQLPNGTIGQVEKITAAGDMEILPLDIQRVALDKVARDYKKFAGKPADRIEKFPAKSLSGPAWKLGTLCGVLYEADTDEGRQRFFHPFAKHARPTLAVLHNGQTLATLGGAFRVTDRGIVDHGE